MFPPVQTLDLTLRRLASELAELTAVANHLEAARDEVGRLDRHQIVEQQALDALTQRLAGLTRFVDILSREAPSRFPLPVARALDSLTLADQARRLAGLPPAARADAGELMLFDAP